MRILSLLIFSGLAWSQSAEQARTVLRDGFVEKSPEKRREVTVALSMVLAKDQVVDLLVRQAVLDSLVDLGDRTRYPIIKEALQDPVPEVFYAAARALWKIGDPPVRSYSKTSSPKRPRPSRTSPKTRCER